MGIFRNDIEELARFMRRLICCSCKPSKYPSTIGPTLYLQNMYCCNGPNSVYLSIEDNCCSEPFEYIILEEFCCTNGSQPGPNIVLKSICCQPAITKLNLIDECCANYPMLANVDTCCMPNIAVLTLTKTCCGTTKEKLNIILLEGCCETDAPISKLILTETCCTTDKGKFGIIPLTICCTNSD